MTSRLLKSSVSNFLNSLILDNFLDLGSGTFSEVF